MSYIGDQIKINNSKQSHKIQIIIIITIIIIHHHSCSFCAQGISFQYPRKLPVSLGVTGGGEVSLAYLVKSSFCIINNIIDIILLLLLLILIVKIYFTSLLAMSTRLFLSLGEYRKKSPSFSERWWKISSNY